METNLKKVGRSPRAVLKTKVVVNITEPAILLCINQVHKRGMSASALYDAIRGVWAVGEKRLRAKLAFGVVHRKIVEVYQIQEWHPAGTTQYSSGRLIDFTAHANDWEFTGTPAPPEIRDKYLDRLAPRFGRNPIRYLNT